MRTYLIINNSVLDRGDISRAMIIAHDAATATAAFAELAEEQGLPLSVHDYGHAPDASQAMLTVPSGHVLVFHQLYAPVKDDKPQDNDDSQGEIIQQEEEPNEPPQQTTPAAAPAPAGGDGGGKPRANPGGGTVPRLSKQERRAARDQQRQSRDQTGGKGGNQTPPVSAQ